jgi:hypothetical protein
VRYGVLLRHHSDRSQLFVSQAMNPPRNQTTEMSAIGSCGFRRASISAAPQAARAADGEGSEETKGPTAKILLPELSGDPGFEDLRVCGLIKERCYVTQRPLARIYLELSDSPPLGWSYILMSRWQTAACTEKARIGIDADTLWIECEPVSLKSHHLPELQKAISETNYRYRTALQDQTFAGQRREGLDREIMEQLDKLDLGLEPRPKPRRRRRILRAYYRPLVMSAFCVLWYLAGLFVWTTTPADKWNFVTFLPLALIWSCVLYFSFRAAFYQFRRRLKIRQSIRQKHVKPLWPDQYVDRKSRGQRLNH